MRNSVWGTFPTFPGSDAAEMELYLRHLPKFGSMLIFPPVYKTEIGRLLHFLHLSTIVLLNLEKK